MPRVEVTLPDRIETQLETLVEQQDDFVSREEATEELLEMGLRAYDPEPDSGRETGMDSDRVGGPDETGQGPGGYDEMGGGGGPEDRHQL